MSPRTQTPPATFIDEGAIISALIAGGRADAVRVREILAKAAEANGLELDEVAALSTISDPELLGELFATARAVKEDIYGKRLVLFAPLYVSNLCENDCLYCAFRVRNKELKRRALTQDEIRHEIEILVDQGHKRVLLVAGESYPSEGFQYVLDSIATIYDVHRGNGEIRRVNVNVAPLTVDEFRALKAAGIGTYQLFQETYHRETYAKVHLGGRKRDYDWRVTGMDRAMEGGIDDVGIGVLFGLFDWRFEILAHPAAHPPPRRDVRRRAAHDQRAAPRAGRRLGHREPSAAPGRRPRLSQDRRHPAPRGALHRHHHVHARDRQHARARPSRSGVSQISAGSRTNPGGYTDDTVADMEQFQLGDHRTLDEVIRDVATDGLHPLVLHGVLPPRAAPARDFMDLAKPGEIKHHCDPNALSTFLEYLEDYGSPETRQVGEQLIAATLAGMAEREHATSTRLIDQVRAGERDCLV